MRWDFRRDQIFHAVHAIPPRSAEAVAALFMKIAEELRFMATQQREKDALIRNARAHNERLDQIPVLISRRLQDGMSLDDAKSDVQKLLDHSDLTTIDYFWRKHEKIRPRLQRSRKAVKMRAAGYTNTEIARALACSPRTVARLLSHPL